MWLLKGDSGNLIYLKPNETLTVGRHRGDIVLPDDGSISRVHAKITVKPVENIGEIQEKTVPLSKVTIEDANSKYGNFILKDDGEEIQITEDGYSLRHTDRIRFGLQNYIFTALYVPIVTATSGMDETEKKQLKEIIDAIDGRISYVWTPMCTHMTIEKPTISEKLSCALVTCTPIVTMDYWKDVFRAFENKEAFPEPADYVAAINNKMKNVGKVCVKPNLMRKTCFRNLTFVHFNSKQYKLYMRMIRLAGGTSIKYGKEKIDLNVSDNNVIVVQMVESNTTQATGTGDANYAAACEQLSRCKRRAIPECEIALAILNCSTEKYCNPMYDYAELFKNRNSQSPDDNTTILALDTQDVDIPTTSGMQKRKTQNHIVMETVEESNEFEFQAPRSLRQCPADSMSGSAASSSYDNESIGSMKLASLNHEKYLEEELNKRSTMSSDRQREPLNHIVKETVEDSESQSDSQGSKTIRGDPSDFISESVASSCYNSDSIGSMKLASLNHEKYLQKEFNEQSAITGNPMKRERVEDVAIDAIAAMKKIRLDTDADCRRKRSLWEKLEVSYADSPIGDEDISEEKIVVNAIPETKEIERNIDTRNNPSISAKEETDADFDFTDEWSVPNPKSKVPNQRVGVSESKEKTSFARDDDNTSRKRKVGRSDASPSRDVPENPRKRNRSSISSEKDISESTKKSVFAAPKRPSKAESDEGVWNRSKDYRPDDDLDSSFGSRKKYDAEISVFFQRPDDPNKSTERLLRITDDAIGTEIGKCFRKRHTTIPRRIELYDASADTTWTSGVNRQKNTSFDNDDVATTHKVSPNTVSRRKKTLRV